MILRIKSYPEYLLLLVPALLFFGKEIIYGNTALDIHLHDTYFVFSDRFLFIGVLVVHFFFFCLHFTLRSLKKRNALFCKVHVYGTLLLYLLLFSASFFYVREEALLPKSYYDISAEDLYSSIPITQLIAMITILLLVLLQAAFILYFCIRIFLKPNKVA